MMIRDDGKANRKPVCRGTGAPGSIGIGIGGMSQRAKEFGGELRLSNTDPGTLVEIAVPFLNPASETTHALI